MSERRIVVVGGGLIGVSCAYFLSKRGARVTLLERQGIGEAASFGNAGSIAPGHSPINKPGRARQALKWIFDPLSPLYVAKPWSPSLLRWLWNFHAHCTPEHVQHCMDLLGPLGHSTLELFDELVETESLDCDYRRAGYYEVFLTGEALRGGCQESSLARRLGHTIDEISSAEMREREPAFVDAIQGALYHRDAATVDPHRFVVELARRCESRGARIRTHAEVDDLLVEGGRVRGVLLAGGERIEADVVLLATGAYSRHLWEKRGLRLPLQAAKGYHRDIDRDSGEAPPLRNACVLAETFVFCTPLTRFVRFAGTLELSGINHKIRHDRLDNLTTAARRYFHHTGAGGTLSEWCGLRPCLADGLPAVGEIPGTTGLFVATGHAMMGLTLAPITGKLVAEQVLDGKPSMAIDAMAAARFARS